MEFDDADFDAETISRLTVRLGQTTLSRRLTLQRDGARSTKHKPSLSIKMARTLVGAPVRRAIRHWQVFAKVRRANIAYEISETSLCLARLPEAFESFRVLHLSDLHIDSIPDSGQMLLKLVSSIPCDLCVITGDFRDPEMTVRSEFRERIRRLCNVIAAKHGTVGVLGNHDTVEDVPFLERLGIRMLLNEAMAIERNGSRIWIVGVDDPHFFGTHDLQKALKDTHTSELHLLLAHSPDLADEAANAGVDVYLCGHSHGGQICLPDRTPIFANMRARREFASGRWRAGGMLGYTSRGVGTSGLPIRAYCRPELTLHFLDRLRSSGSPLRPEATVCFRAEDRA